MAAVEKNIVVEQGATFRLGFTYCEDGVDETTPGPPYNLTDCTARLQVRLKPHLDAVLLEASTDTNDGITLGGAAGTVEIVISDEKSEAMGPLPKTVNAVYDLKLYWPGGDETRLLKGKCTIDPAVTRDAA